MKIGLKNIGIHVNNIHSLEDGVAVFRNIMNELGAQPEKIPTMFYGTLHELVSDNLILPPKLDDNGKFIPTQKGQILRAINGEVAYLYIPDFENVYKKQWKRNKIHMYWCSTLSRMWNENREDRYWGTTDTKGLFGLTNGTKVKMNVCSQDCFQRIKDPNYGTVDNFDFEKFSQDHSNTVKLNYGEKKSDGKYWWKCCKCGVETDDIENIESEGADIYCNNCYEIEQSFKPLKDAKTEKDIDDWFKNYESTLVDATGMNMLMYLAQYNPKPEFFKISVKKYDVNIMCEDKNGKNTLMYLVDRPCNCNKIDYLQKQCDELKSSIDMLLKLGLDIKHYDKKRIAVMGYTKNKLLKELLVEYYEKAGGQITLGTKRIKKSV